jgi:deoxyribodipyrimidine photo-lyase
VISPGAQLAKPGSGAVGAGGIVYWMQRDKRVQDNWALLRAAELSEAHAVPLSVVYCLEPPGQHATPRELCFRLKGLAEVRSELDKLRVPFRLLRGEVASELAGFCVRHEVAAVVCDFSPLREPRAWKDGLVEQAPNLPVYEVDAHNIVPVWVASDKQEVGARTIRKKITDKLPTWLVDIPVLPPRPADGPALSPGMRDECAKERIKDWQALLSDVLSDPRVDSSVGEVDGFVPGPKAALQAVDRFCSDRLKIYADKRNDPNVEACSDLSPYLNFGQLSAQRMALKVKELSKNQHEGVSAFLEESIVRRELSDNFLHHQPHYDSLDGAAGWARESLQLHAADK